MARRVLIFVCMLCLLAAGPAGAADKAFSDKAVEAAIAKGVKFLFNQQKPDGNWDPYGAKGEYPTGPSAMAVYALMESGISPQDKRLEKALAWLAKTPTKKTYSLGLRCNVWQTANIYTRKRYHQLLIRESRQLRDGTTNGSYGYSVPGAGDNSNSQYGLLGVWAARRGDIEIPKKYWQLVLSHWLRSQSPNGGWNYGTGTIESTATMTAAGVASLFVCFDNLFAQKFKGCEAGFRLPAIERGLAWFDKNFRKTIKGGPNYYYLYGVERVGLASGYKYFGTADWYKLGAQKLLSSQSGDGWGNVVNTSFALLFLVRGRNPVLFNKLEFHGDWNNRPRDLAMLTRWLSRTFEVTVNWQIINLRVPVRELHDAPILYITGAKRPTFSEDELDKLRQYVWQGGTIFSARECKGTGFGKGIREIYKKLFPEYKLTECKPGHEIYKVYFTLRGRPKFSVISNGIRPLVIHTDEDLPMSWQLQKVATKRKEFEAAANIFMYTTDKGTLRRRGTTLWPAKPKFTPVRTIRLARLKTTGRYDPEPLAYERLALLMGRETKVQLDVLGPMDINELAQANAQLATITGVDAFSLTAEQREALKAFVAGGGTLVLDAAGGSKAFRKSAEGEVQKMYGPDALEVLSSRHDLYRNPLDDVAGMRIDKVGFRRITRKMLGKQKTPRLEAALVKGRPAVIYSRQDITAGLVGYPSLTADGYDPGDAGTPGSAYRIMRNIVLYSARGSKGPTPTSATASP